MVEAVHFQTWNTGGPRQRAPSWWNLPLPNPCYLQSRVPRRTRTQRCGLAAGEAALQIAGRVACIAKLAPRRKFKCGNSSDTPRLLSRRTKKCHKTQMKMSKSCNNSMLKIRQKKSLIENNSNSGAIWTIADPGTKKLRTGSRASLTRALMNWMATFITRTVTTLKAALCRELIWSLRRKITTRRLSKTFQVTKR